MTSIGEQLRHARELRGLSLDQIADDTNIARRFLNSRFFRATPTSLAFYAITPST